MNLRHQDTISGVALAALAAGVMLMSLGMGSGAAGSTLAPSFFPMVCAAGLGLCGVILLVRGLRSEGRMPLLLDQRTAIVGLMLALELWWFDLIDFRVAAWAFTLVTMLVFGIRRPLLLALYPVVVSAVLFLTFAHGFKVVLPTWI